MAGTRKKYLARDFSGRVTEKEIRALDTVKPLEGKRYRLHPRNNQFLLYDKKTGEVLLVFSSDIKARAVMQELNWKDEHRHEPPKAQPPRRKSPYK